MKTATEKHEPYLLKALDETYLEQCFALATQVFAEGSTLHRALGIQLDEYREYLRPSFRAMVAEGLSVVSIDPNTDEVLGCLIATEFPQEISTPTESNDTFAALSALTVELVKRYARKRRIKCGDAVLVDMGAVSSGAARKGIYRAMRSKINEVALDRGYRIILGELSSSATQHVVLTQLGHRKMAEVLFADFEYQGSRPFASITDPMSIVMSEGDLT